MSEKTSMFKLLNERMEKEDIVKLVCNYDNQFNELEEENKRLNNIINELEKIISLDFNYVNDDLSDNFVFGIRNEAKSIYRELQELKRK